MGLGKNSQNEQTEMDSLYSNFKTPTKTPILAIIGSQLIHKWYEVRLFQIYCPAKMLGRDFAKVRKINYRVLIDCRG